MGNGTLDPERTRGFLHQAARRVAAEVRREWRLHPAKMGDDMGMGADGTPTKYIDKLAEDVLLATLADADLPLNVLSEECGFIDNGHEHTLVMDPIDGTRNATHGIPFFCTALAIGKKSVTDIEYALVRNLSTDDIFYARRGHGATLNSEPLKVKQPDPDEILVAAIYDKADDLQRYLTHEHVHVRDMGSSALEIALIAAGAFDAFACHFPFLRVVDIAASTLILREAGGAVHMPDRSQLDTAFNLKARTPVIAVSHPSLLEVLL